MKVRIEMNINFDSITAPWMALTKDYENAASAFHESLQSSPSQLNFVGRTLKTMSSTKERFDQSMEKIWASFRLVSATDVERVYERLGAIQDRLETLAECLGVDEENKIQNEVKDNA